MRTHAPEPGPQTPAGAAAGTRVLASVVGNRARQALAAGGAPRAGARGMAPDVRRLAASSPPSATSPPNVPRPADAALEGLELTSPWDYVVRGWNWVWGSAPPAAPANTPAPAPAVTPPSPAPPPAPAGPSVPVQNPTSLTIKGSGAIEGTYGISQYWPVTNYWGADKTLGVFDEPLAGHAGWRMKGHKFQVVGEFATGTTTSGAGGNVQFLQEARITTTKGGSPGSWFNDMDYVDAGGGGHHWDPNAEAGTTGAGGHAGVRRTIATNKYAYTDPPAISYLPKVGTTAGSNSYRKLEFRIKLIAPPGSSGSTMTRYATQEIEVVDGAVTIHQAP